MNTKFNASNENDWDLDEIVKDVKTHVEMFKSTIPKHRVQPGEGSDLDSVLNESAANIVRKTPNYENLYNKSKNNGRDFLDCLAYSHINPMNLKVILELVVKHLDEHPNELIDDSWPYLFMSAIYENPKIIATSDSVFRYLHWNFQEFDNLASQSNFYLESHIKKIIISMKNFGYSVEQIKKLAHKEIFSILLSTD